VPKADSVVEGTNSSANTAWISFCTALDSQGESLRIGNAFSGHRQEYPAGVCCFHLARGWDVNVHHSARIVNRAGPIRFEVNGATCEAKKVDRHRHRRQHQVRGNGVEVVGFTGGGQFLFSFFIAGLVALTYSVLGVQFVVLRILYPRIWGDGQEWPEQARPELAPVASRLWVLQLLAEVIPLTAAALLVGTGPDQLPGSNYRNFRLLVTGLIGLGTTGLVLAVSVSGFLSRTLIVLTSGERRAHSP
jgi:hypothetical protein